MSPNFSNMLYSLSLLLLLWAGASSSEEGISVISVKGPVFVERGHSLTLKCIYDLRQCSLYSIRWSFNDEAFLTYNPEYGLTGSDDAPPVLVDIEASTLDTMVLSNARIRDTGVYKCTVTSEGVQYFKDTKEINVTVGVLPDEKPHIEPPVNDAAAEKESYQPGDDIYLVCVSPPSYPAATLNWVLNEKKVDSSGLVVFDPVRTPDALLTSRLGLNITLAASHFKKGKVQLECTSDIGTVKSSSLSRRLLDADFKPSPSLGALGPSLGPIGSLQIFLQLMVIIVVGLLL